MLGGKQATPPSDNQEAKRRGTKQQRQTALPDAGAHFRGPRERGASWSAAAVRRYRLERNHAFNRP